MVFKDKETSIKKLYNKAWSLTLEAMSTTSQGKLATADLYVEERNFIGYFLDKNNNTHSRSNTNISNISSYSWKIRMKDEEFSLWLIN